MMRLLGAIIVLLVCMSLKIENKKDVEEVGEQFWTAETPAVEVGSVRWTARFYLSVFQGFVIPVLCLWLVGTSLDTMMTRTFDMACVLGYPFRVTVLVTVLLWAVSTPYDWLIGIPIFLFAVLDVFGIVLAFCVAVNEDIENPRRVQPHFMTHGDRMVMDEFLRIRLEARDDALDGPPSPRPLNDLMQEFRAQTDHLFVRHVEDQRYIVSSLGTLRQGDGNEILYPRENPWREVESIESCKTKQIVWQYRQMNFNRMKKTLRKSRKAVCEHMGIPLSVRMERIASKGVSKERRSVRASHIEQRSLKLDPQAMDPGHEFMLKLLEDLALLVYNLSRPGRLAKVFALIGFVKMRLDGSLVKEMQDQIEAFVKKEDWIPQSGEENDWMSTLRGCVDRYEEYRNADLFKKVFRFLSMAIGLSLFARLGLGSNIARMIPMDREVAKIGANAPDFVHAIMDLVVFFCERGQQCFRTRSLDPIFHSGDKYTEWCREARELKEKSAFLSNPAIVKMDPYAYFEKLSNVVERGEAIAKHASATGYFYKKLVDALLADLKLIKADLSTKRYCQSDRSAPFAVLVYGYSGVCKSSFSYMLFQAYGKIRGLQCEDIYRYVRNSMEEFWTNFESFMWCVHLDDIARLKPGCTSDIDPTMEETISVINNVPYTPSQAALEDKGRTPVRPEFVIATTNVHHMNVSCFFSEPYAVQRRFPWVVELQPKKRYANGKSIDASRLPEPVDGSLPNHWIIKVHVVDQPEKSGDAGALRKVQEFTEIDDFMQWFGEQVRKHHELQDRAERTNKVVRDIQLCENTCRPVKSCVCADCLVPQANPVVVARDIGLKIFEWWTWFMLAYLSLSVIFFSSVHVIVSMWSIAGLVFVVGQRVMLSARMRWRISMSCLRHIGNSIAQKMQTNWTLVAISAGFAGCAATYMYMRSAFTMFLSAQGMGELGGERPVPVGREPVNPWFKDSFVLHPVELAPAAPGLKSLPPEDLVRKLGHNVFKIRARTPGSNAFVPVHMVGLEGNLFVTVNHAIPSGKCQLEIEQEPVDQVGVSHIAQLSESDMYRYPARDLIFLRIQSMPLVKTLTRCFSEKIPTGGVYTGLYLPGPGSPTNQLDGLEPRKIKTTFGEQVSFHGTSKRLTVKGDCGQLQVLLTHYGPTLVGIHNFGDTAGSNQVVSTTIVQNDIREALKHFRIMTSANALNVVQEGEELELMDLNEKSPFRWIPQGVAVVYGSLNRFRATMTSHVRESPICMSVMDRMSYAIEYGRPCMKGWEPLRNALVDIVKKPMLADVDIVRQVARDKVCDVLHNIPVGELKLIQKYDLFTAVNGAAGVAYVDKLNRNTSAGFPFNTRKSKFMVDLGPQDGLSNPVEFTEEILDRIKWMVSQYKAGKMANPVFQACLKDEALPFEKIHAKKTRVFTGGPVDFTVVGRMYLLSFIRLVQRNRYPFSCAVGTVAQGVGWHELRAFLVQHGEDRIVAGDYSRFDRSVEPAWQTAAWYVIKAIVLLSRAYALGVVTEEEIVGVTPLTLDALLDKVLESDSDELQEFVKVLEGIQADTVHPLVNFFGDLVRFFGIVPSGHFLTVVLNSIINELYLRYAYVVIRPDNVVPFLKVVALMTYGDDNIFGVHKSIPWYNHSTISQALAEIGLVYTMADKHAETRPYIHIDEASFLKRKFVFQEEFGHYVCPLDPSSIGKMLTVWTYSKTLCPGAQAEAVMSTAAREYAWYGRQEFERRVAQLKEVVLDCNLEPYIKPSTFPSFDSLVEAFYSISEQKLSGA